MVFVVALLLFHSIPLILSMDRLEEDGVGGIDGWYRIRIIELYPWVPFSFGVKRTVAPQWARFAVFE